MPTEQILTENEKQAIKVMEELAIRCYKRGFKDALLYVAVGASVTGAGILGLEMVKGWRQKKKILKFKRDEEET